MAGIFDFIKKQTPDASSTVTAGSPQASNPDPVANAQQQSSAAVPSQGQSYNGIGTPSQGQSFNGVGSPPQGQSFNGVGTPPSQPQQNEPVQNQNSQSSDPSKISDQGLTPSQAQEKVETDQQVIAQQKTVEPAAAESTDQGPVTPDQPENKDQQAQAISATEPQQSESEQPSQKQEKTSATEEPSDEKKLQEPSDAKKMLSSQLSGKQRNDIDIMTHLTQRSNKVFVDANNKAKELHNQFIDSEHLLHGLLIDGEIYKILVDLKLQPQIVEQELAKVYKKEEFSGAPQPSPRAKQIIEKSLVIARKLGFEFISPEHLLLALYEEGEGVGARLLVKLGVTKEDINKRITGKKAGVEGIEPGKEQKQKTKSALEQYCIDLTQKAANGELDPVVERAPVIERVVHILSRRIKNNPALIGEPGVGKTAVVEGLAQRIVGKQVPESLLNKRIMQLDLVGVIAGASHRGEFEERMKNIVDELKASKGEIIMFIDEMHTMMGAGSGDGALDASNFIKPALARGEVQFIGATTITEYRRYIEKDAALERRFQTVLVPEPTEEAAIKMLKAARDKYESYHKVKISDEVIELAVKLSKRYIGDRFLPDKGFDLMDEAAAAVRLPLISLPEEIKSIENRISQLQADLSDNERRGEKVKARILRSKIDDIQGKLKLKQDEYNMKRAQTTTAVTPNIVKDIIAMRTGIPISKIGSSEGDKLAQLEDIIHKRMIDQERAVAAVAQAVRRGRAGLKSNNRPIGSFVFLGPTGVGKTELAKTLSEVLFDEEEAVIRFDMTEYMERHEVAKLLGPPPGYVGFEEGGKLTEAVRRKPYSLILFDEIEKAHPDIFNILLQILDDARLTDNKGRTITFKNTVIICTSNIGTPLIQKELLKSGKSEVTEPTVVSTYVFTPRGRELMTIGNKYFEREGGVQQLDAVKEQLSRGANEQKNQDAKGSKEKKSDSQQASAWVNHQLPEYFAGQKVENKKSVTTKQESQPPEGLEKDPQQQTQASPDGEEIEKTQQEVKVTSFPTFGYDTHAISSQGIEMITTGDLLYARNATTSKVWDVTNLIEYFTDQVVVNALPDTPDEQLPTVRLKTHAFSPDGMEIVTYKDRYWKRKIDTNEWQTGLLKEYFAEQTQKESLLPVTHWDIHTYSPAGKEVIIVGTDVWTRGSGSSEWQKQTLEQYFGDNFPLDKEVEEKEKVEEETDIKKYQVIKDKVMGELLKFFRPELVNRFDEVIVFEPLKFKHMLMIVELQLKGLGKLLEEQEIGFAVTDVAKKAVVREGFDPVFGARPLRRAIQKLVENPISELIIAQKVKAGDTLIVDYDGDEFIFNVEKIEHKEAETDSQDQSIRHAEFDCNKCSNRFDTDVIARATTVCSKCSSQDVRELDGASEKVQKQQDKKPPKKGSPMPEGKESLSVPKDESQMKIDQQQPVRNQQKNGAAQPNGEVRPQVSMNNSMPTVPPASDVPQSAENAPAGQMATV